MDNVSITQMAELCQKRSLTIFLILKHIIMKNLIVLAAVTFGMTFASCEKCVTCEFDFFGTTTSEEYCSKDKDSVDAYETSCKANGGTVK